MVCPVCSASACRRSRRRTLVDYCAALTGSLPWRCTDCGTRFRSRSLPIADLLSARCLICGNYDLKRIAAEHVNSVFAPFWRMLGVPAFRCIPCRHKFFSVRPLSKEVERDRWKMAS